jgi:hypothetical protein
MLIENLRPEDVKEVTDKVNEIALSNPFIRHKTFDMEAKETVSSAEQLIQIHEKIASLERKLDLIFGGHVLINGVFTKI